MTLSGSPPGPGDGRALAELRQHLQNLHLHAGEPSTRTISRQTGKAISHTTVSAVLKCAKVPRFEQLELVVEALGGDVAEFKRLWVAARLASQSEPVGKAASGPSASIVQPVVTGNDEPVQVSAQQTVSDNELTAIHDPIVGHGDAVVSVAFSPDGHQIATSSKDAIAWLWDSSTRAPVGEPLTGHSGPVWAVAFSPDGRLLATGGHDATIRLWDMTTHTPVGDPLTGHTGTVVALAFSPRGRLLASASRDATVRLWNPTTGTPVGDPLTGHSDAVVSVAFSPAGQLLATASHDGTTRLWKLASPHHERLTRMENEILGLIAEGLTDRGIAERLNYSVRTIESHIQKIVRKLDIGIDQNWRVLMALAWLRGGI